MFIYQNWVFEFFDNLGIDSDVQADTGVLVQFLIPAQLWLPPFVLLHHW
jgi:hypothetical protein